MDAPPGALSTDRTAVPGERGVASAPYSPPLLFVSIALTVIALLLWLAALPAIHVTRANDLGIVSVLPPIFFVAIAVISVAFALALHRQPLSVPLACVQVIALIVMLYGLPLLLEAEPHFQGVYRHAGITDYIVVHGSVDPGIDAYFNWPGFFILAAFMTEVTGISSPLALGHWAPVFVDLMYLGPLVLVCRARSADRRPAWLAIWLFYATDWVDQDYFAPQGWAFIEYLALTGILLVWFRVQAVPGKPYGEGLIGSAVGKLPRLLRQWFTPEASSSPVETERRPLLMVVAVVLVIATVMGHQLTPFAMLLTVAALVLLNQCSARGLPILIGVIIATWIVYVTVPFLLGNFAGLAHGVGNVGANVGSNVGHRVAGSPRHLFVVRERIAMTGAVWLLALLGGLQSLRFGSQYVVYGGLAAAPFALVGLQSYGGEALLRAYFYSLPFMAVLVAVLFYPSINRGTSWITPLVIAVMSLLLVVGFLFARYGNLRIDYFASGEVQAMNYLYRTAPSKSQFLAIDGNVPWKFRGYASYNYVSSSALPTHVRSGRDVLDIPRSLKRLARELDNQQYPASYLLFTRGQGAWADLFGELPRGSYPTLRAALAHSTAFRTLYHNTDASIFVRAASRHPRARGRGLSACGTLKTSHTSRLCSKQQKIR